MRKWLLVSLMVCLSGCVTPATSSGQAMSYQVACATSLGTEIISGRFSQVEVLDGGAFSLVSPTGRRVIVNGFCIAMEMR